MPWVTLDMELFLTRKSARVVLMGTFHRQTIPFTQPQIEYLKAEAARLGISVADLVRRIIDQHRSGK